MAKKLSLQKAASNQEGKTMADDEKVELTAEELALKQQEEALDAKAKANEEALDAKAKANEEAEGAPHYLVLQPFNHFGTPYAPGDKIPAATVGQEWPEGCIDNRIEYAFVKFFAK